MHKDLTTFNKMTGATKNRLQIIKKEEKFIEKNYNEREEIIEKNDKKEKKKRSIVDIYLHLNDYIV